MVFFFIAFLFAIVLFGFPVKMTALGYWDKSERKLRFMIKLSLYEKPFGKKKETAPEEAQEEKKPNKFRFPKIPLTNIPLSLLKEVRVSVCLTDKEQGAAVFLSMLGAAVCFTPIKVSVFRGEKAYTEISVKLSCTLHDIFPAVLQTLLKREKQKYGNNSVIKRSGGER